MCVYYLLHSQDQHSKTFLRTPKPWRLSWNPEGCGTGGRYEVHAGRGGGTPPKTLGSSPGIPKGGAKAVCRCWTRWFWGLREGCGESWVDALVSQHMVSACLKQWRYLLADFYQLKKPYHWTKKPFDFVPQSFLYSAWCLYSSTFICVPILLITISYCMSPAPDFNTLLPNELANTKH
jgi:hypothetical protein